MLRGTRDLGAVEEPENALVGNVGAKRAPKDTEFPGPGGADCGAVDVRSNCDPMATMKTDQAIGMMTSI